MKILQKKIMLIISCLTILCAGSNVYAFSQAEILSQLGLGGQQSNVEPVVTDEPRELLTLDVYDDLGNLVENYADVYFSANLVFNSERSNEVTTIEIIDEATGEDVASEYYDETESDNTGEFIFKIIDEGTYKVKATREIMPLAPISVELVLSNGSEENDKAVIEETITVVDKMMIAANSFMGNEPEIVYGDIALGNLIVFPIHTSDMETIIKIENVETKTDVTTYYEVPDENVWYIPDAGTYKLTATRTSGDIHEEESRTITIMDINEIIPEVIVREDTSDKKNVYNYKYTSENVLVSLSRNDVLGIPIKLVVYTFDDEYNEIDITSELEKDEDGNLVVSEYGEYFAGFVVGDSDYVEMALNFCIVEETQPKSIIKMNEVIGSGNEAINLKQLKNGDKTQYDVRVKVEYPEIEFVESRMAIARPTVYIGYYDGEYIQEMSYDLYDYQYEEYIITEPGIWLICNGSIGGDKATAGYTTYEFNVIEIYETQTKEEEMWKNDEFWADMILFNPTIIAEPENGKVNFYNKPMYNLNIDFNRTDARYFQNEFNIWNLTMLSETGKFPNISYIPNEDFVGEDTFKIYGYKYVGNMGNLLGANETEVSEEVSTMSMNMYFYNYFVPVEYTFKIKVVDNISVEKFVTEDELFIEMYMNEVYEGKEFPLNDVDGERLYYDIDYYPEYGELEIVSSGTSLEDVVYKIKYEPEKYFVGEDYFDIFIGKRLDEKYTRAPMDVGMEADPVSDDIYYTQYEYFPTHPYETIILTYDVLVRERMLAISGDKFEITKDAPVERVIDAIDYEKLEVTVEPENGTLILDELTGEYTYTPNEGFTGTDSFYVKAVVDENTETEEVLYEIKVSSELYSEYVISSDDTAVTIYLNTKYETEALPTVDEDGNTINYSFKSEPANGTVSIENGKLVFTPNSDFEGDDEFILNAKSTVLGDVYEDTNVIRELDITFTVKVVKNEMSIQGGNITTKKNVSSKGTITASGFEKLVVTKAPENGTLDLNEDTGEYTYTPNAGYTGSDSFEIEAIDEYGLHTEAVKYSITVKKLSSGGGYSVSSSKDDDKDEDEKVEDLKPEDEEIVPTESGEQIPVEETEKNYSLKIENEGKHTGYVKGYTDGTVRPDGNITREEIAMIFYRLTISEDKDVFENTEAPYSDVEADRWSSIAIAYLKEKGILKGYPDGTFRPKAQVTRAEFAALAQNYLSPEKLENLTFNDIESSHWAKDIIELVTSKGWMQGYNDGSFKPENKITRAETMTVLNRMLLRDSSEVKREANVFTDLIETHWAYREIIEATANHTYGKGLEGFEIWETYMLNH